MNNRKAVRLQDIHLEDVEDVLMKLEKSFGIRYHDNAFRYARNFGDICDILLAQIKTEHRDDCTTQQAFYKVRAAISRALLIDESNVRPDTELHLLFPRKHRRESLMRVQQLLGFRCEILVMKEWLALLLVACFLGSLIIFFFDWKLAVSGLALFYALFGIASRYSKELHIRTVRQFTELLVREHYSAVRRNKGTINRSEICQTIQHAFVADLGLDRHSLTRESILGQEA